MLAQLDFTARAYSGVCASLKHRRDVAVMPAQSTISAADKERIKATFPSSNAKILTATLARVYYAYPSPDEWSYSGLQGAIALVSDKIKGGFWLRLVDLSVSCALPKARRTIQY